MKKKFSSVFSFSITCGLLFLSFLSAEALADRSIYTKLKKCHETRLENLPARECSGVGDWKVLVVYEQERSFLVLMRGNYLKNFREEIYASSNGQFPEISSSKIEWRLDAHGKIQAMIFRVRSLNPDKSLQRDESVYQSWLMVVRVGEVACFLGRESDNRQARQLADSALVCEGQGAISASQE